MSEQIKKGDVVELKSGGPKMTVEWVEEEDGEMTAYCVWFKENQKEGDRFSTSALNLISE